MKTGEIIIGIVLTASIFAPLFYLYFLSNRKKMKIERALKLLAKRHDMRLSEFEIWNQKGLGFDSSKRALVYVSILNDLPTEKHVNLLDVKSAKVVANHDVVTIQINTYSSDVINLEIFNSLFDEPLNSRFHLLLAKKWVDYLNNLIKNNTQKAA